MVRCPSSVSEDVCIVQDDLVVTDVAKEDGEFPRLWNPLPSQNSGNSVSNSEMECSDVSYC